MMSEIFYTLVLTTSSGLFLALCRMLYKSKCKTIKFCGCEIDRDVAGEEKIDEIEANRSNRNNENKTDL